jgi:isocitrate dehydrogenase
MEAIPAPIYFETQYFTAAFIDSIRCNKFVLKGGLVTPVGGGFYILNMQLYKELNLYASPINCANIASSG